MLREYRQQAVRVIRVYAKAQVLIEQVLHVEHAAPVPKGPQRQREQDGPGEQHRREEGREYCKKLPRTESSGSPRDIPVPRRRFTRIATVGVAGRTRRARPSIARASRPTARQEPSQECTPTPRQVPHGQLQVNRKPEREYRVRKGLDGRNIPQTGRRRP